MPKAIRAYIRWIDSMNRSIGRVMMYGIFAMMGILFWSTITKVGSDIGLGINPSLWTLETAQFAMVAYYMIGGPYAIQMGSNVRMDLFYGNWSDRRKAWFDAFTVFFLIFYLVFLLVGAYSSIEYAVMYGQKNRSAWAPYMAPIKIIMGVGVLLMLLQAIATFFKDLAKARGETI